MVKIRALSGRVHYVAAENVRRVSEASPNDSGIRSYVKLHDGMTVECVEAADEVAAAVDRERHLCEDEA